MPLIKYVIIKNESKPNKWYDNELTKLKQKKWKARLDWLNCRNDQMWAHYVLVRNTYNNLIKLKKK